MADKARSGGQDAAREAAEAEAKAKEAEAKEAEAKEAEARAEEADAEPVLPDEEEEKVHRVENVPTTVIFEAIRREGNHELSRPFSALWWSGIAAGIAISSSVLSKGALVSVLPDADWAPAVSNLGYAVGFLIVILARMQLFTENTITPILPLFIAPTWRKLGQIARLWAIVFLANMTGCFVAAWVMAIAGILPEARLEGVLAISRHYAEASGWEHVMRGIPAGFMIAALVWIMPRMEDAGEILMIIIVTYVIGLADMSHVVAGATELFVLVLSGELSVSAAVFGGILPALLGNVIGGTGIFVALVYGQLRDEIWEKPVRGRNRD
ncbi:formate/nitrite transporter family protein [Poseidonocella sedimentorum]|uniref:Formate/nitrite transporter FocA, FNT family n=1 Tax=Poseidonocella sedimentorum TaxID=871652 RepID=A0A1I6DEY2_9RHOB|nr:formate/nitrite transporter family protein [Poseidonocella sedimentorum]SFR04015.1 Formate/nitrite transporter FocA, FNT family [Poseidonocella sedimentorum]